MQTPFPQSYWVRPGLVCAGHYPGDLDPCMHDRKLRGLLACGIRRVVNLIPAAERGANGEPFDPYAPILQTLAGQHKGWWLSVCAADFPTGACLNLPPCAPFWRPSKSKGKSAVGIPAGDVQLKPSCICSCPRNLMASFYHPELQYKLMG